MTKTELANTASELPAYLQGVNAASQDNFDASDVALPQIKLLQATSDEVKNHEKAVPGHFWHTGMDLDLGPQIEFVIAARNKKYLLAAPMDDGQGVLARAPDAKTWDREGEWTVQVDKKTKATWTIADTDVEKSGLTEWGTFDPEDENSPPAATLFYDYLVIVIGNEELGPAVLSCGRSQIKKAKKGLNDKISLHAGQNRPMQALVFRAKAMEEKNGAGQDYFNLGFTQNGFAPEALYNDAVAMKDMLVDYQVKGEGDVEEKPKAQDKGEGSY